MINYNVVNLQAFFPIQKMYGKINIILIFANVQFATSIDMEAKTLLL